MIMPICAGSVLIPKGPQREALSASEDVSRGISMWYSASVRLEESFTVQKATTLLAAPAATPMAARITKAELAPLFQLHSP